MSDTIFLRRGDELIPMKRAEYDSERLLQDLLARYPDLIAGVQISADEPCRWLLISREMTVPSADGIKGELFLDHLFVDQAGTPTLIEVKHSANPELRRSVVGQMLDYASRAVAHWSAEELEARFCSRCEREGLDAEAEIRRLLRAPDIESLDAAPFWRSVETKLRAGEIRLIFVAGHIPEELQRVIEFLNTQMQFAEVLGIEVPQYVGADLQTLVPRVYGLTAETRARKGGARAQRPANAWKEPDFLAHLESTCGEQTSQTASRILAQLSTEGAMASGCAYAMVLSWPLVQDANLNKNREWVWPFYLMDNGTVAVVWQFLKNKPPFEQESKRRELIAMLNGISGVSLPVDAIQGRPTFPIAALADP